MFLNISQDLVAVGGSRDENNYDTSIDDKESNAILERCCKICPSLKVMKKNTNDCVLNTCLLSDYYHSKCGIIAPVLVPFSYTYTSPYTYVCNK